jgi:high-affinity iron transporter
MLINTVLVFTRDLLPLFILLSVLLQLNTQSKTRLLAKAAFVASAVMLLITPVLGSITRLAEGNGLELLFVLLLSLLLLCLLLQTIHWRYRTVTIFAALSLQMLICAINLLLFSLTSVGIAGAAESLWLGAVLALGICSSIAVLAYQLLAELGRISRWWLGVMLALLAARQGSEVINLLSQTDLITQQDSVWDSSSLLAEQSELGVFFHAWFGYEATPDIVQLAAWAGVFVLVLVLWRRQIR